MNQAAQRLLNEPESDEFVDITTYGDTAPRYELTTTALQKKLQKAQTLYVAGEISIDDLVELTDALYETHNRP